MSNLLVTPPSPTYLPLNTSHSTYDKLASSPSCSSPSSPVMSLSLDEQLAALCDTVIGDISSRLEGAEYALDFLLPQTTSPGPIDQSHGQQHIDATPTNTQSGTSTNNHTFASTMTDPHSSSNSPPDFAFAAPNLSHGGDGLLGESKVFSSNMSPPSIQPNFSYHPFNYHAGSSFSSSGSATGTSFSSADTSLPAISRDFARPSVTETRRPATAGGALVTRPFSGNTTMEPPIMEEGEPTMQDLNAAASRRASESQVPWNNFGDAFSGMSMLHQQHQQQHQQQLNQQHQQAFARPANVNMRPQTSDGVPLASAGPSLPSTSTIASQIDYRLPYRPGHEMMHNTFPGDRSYSMSGVRPSYITPSSSSDNGTRIAEDGSLQFVSLGGPAPRKRPRRRYDEIERLYLCGWNGCEKSYGTLNHLNAHVAMQKHGEKRLPQGRSSCNQSSRRISANFYQSSRRCANRGEKRDERKARHKPTLNRCSKCQAGIEVPCLHPPRPTLIDVNHPFPSPHPSLDAVIPPTRLMALPTLDPTLLGP